MQIPSNSKLTFSYSVFSVLFCWFYGFPALAMAIIGFLESKKLGSQQHQPKNKWLLQKAKIVSVTGFVFSLFFTIYYLIAFVNGTFIRW